MNLRQAAQRALKAMEDGEDRADMIEFSDALIALRAALAEPEQEQRADAHLFYAPGDVLICKESGEKAKVINGNTGPLQLANGKISLQWSDEVHGEYTLGQIMDGFIRQAEPEQEPFGCDAERYARKLREEREAYKALFTEHKPQTTHWEGCEAVHPECKEKNT